MSAEPGERRESLWLGVDAELLRALDAIAKAKNITRHEAARVAMRLGVELVRRRAGRGPR